MRRIVWVAVVVGAMALLSACGTGNADEEVTAGTPASSAATEFLDRFMDTDGRVVRRDQGGDTVSEGQAYAMLLAVSTRDRRRFDLAWGWARRNLQRNDGLLSYLWRDGKVVDPQAASDADVDAAHALVLAGHRFRDRSLRRQGLRLASAILAKETLRRGHRRVLVAGPWARQGKTWINPSYFSPRGFAVLARATGDRRWGRLRRSSARLTAQLTRSSPGLPPDWAYLTGSGRARPSGSPDGKSARFGYDAVRVPLRLVWGCGARERRLAARSWSFLHGQAGGGIAPEYSLDGRRLAQGASAPAMVAGAGAAMAAGNRGAAARLLDRAAAQERSSPTYYGSALVALGRVVIESRALGPRCR